jgi:hypothetical protein
MAEYRYAKISLHPSVCKLQQLKTITDATDGRDRWAKNWVHVSVRKPMGETDKSQFLGDFTERFLPLESITYGNRPVKPKRLAYRFLFACGGGL